MGTIYKHIEAAIAADEFLISYHADERLEERGVSAWQVVSGFVEATLVREHPTSTPNPTVVVRQLLSDGCEIEVVWAYLRTSRQAKLVTVYLL